MKLITTCLIFSALSFGQSKAISQEAVLKSVLVALGAKDTKALQELTISKDEFKKYVWPNVASNVVSSSNGMNADKFFVMYEQSSQVGINQGLSQFGGKSLEVVSVTPGSTQKKNKDYTLFLAPEVVIRENGQERKIHPVGGLLEKGGEFKVTTSYTRDSK